MNNLDGIENPDAKANNDKVKSFILGRMMVVQRSELLLFITYIHFAAAAM